MTTTRTVTVHDHEVFVRTIEVPDEVSQASFSEITGGRRTAAITASVGILVVVVALMPTITNFFH
ncbi:MAG: hypothetical protein JWP75_805 [Frondihabitans sp.]|nr:hypothetical protein [Frondihabitans sp.]